MRLVLVRISGDNLPKYDRAVTKSFSDAVLTTVFDVSILSKNSLMHLSTKSRK